MMTYVQQCMFVPLRTDSKHNLDWCCSKKYSWKKIPTPWIILSNKLQGKQENKTKSTNTNTLEGWTQTGFSSYIPSGCAKDIRVSLETRARSNNKPHNENYIARSSYSIVSKDIGHCFYSFALKLWDLQNGGLCHPNCFFLYISSSSHVQFLCDLTALLMLFRTCRTFCHL